MAKTSPTARAHRGALRRGGQGALQLAVQSALIGGAVGVFEGARVLALGADVAAAAIVAGCAAAAALLLALAVVAALAIAEGLPWPAQWKALWRETPPALLWWRVALAAGAVGGVALVTYRVSAYAHVAFRFNEPAPVALLLTGVVVAAVAGLGLGALLVDVVVARRLRRRGAAEERGALGGLRRLALVLGAATLGVLLVVAAVRWTVPALNAAPVATYAVLVASALALRVLRSGRSWSARAAAVAIGAAAVLSMIGSTGSAAARGEAVSHGVMSKRALRALWARGDGDGDGYARAAFGGADCDDRDPRRSPAAQEVPGNGVDENCSGGDGEVAAMAHRLAGGATAPADAAPADAATATAALPTATAAAAAGPNVLLISFDALRADHLGAWGYRRPTSPNLDALAARSARFAWAMTSCPSTRCAVPALLTGRYASTLRDGEVVPTLASALGGAGWETATITCCSRFAGDGEELGGFSLVDASSDALRQKRAGQSNSDEVVRKVVRWLERRGSAGAAAPPFFVWTHLYDPHGPYQAPEEPRRFGDSDLDRYDAEIRFADAQVGHLLAELARLGLAERTIVVITSDHGDEFGEHGIRFHARSLFNQVVRIPLLVHVPPSLGGAAAGLVEQHPVSLVDVTPTVLELAGVALPSGMNGRSLAAAVRGTAAAPARPVLIELVPDHQIERDMAAIVWGSWKAIWDRQANAWSLYSLADDPGDAVDLVEEPRQGSLGKLAELERLLRAALDAELGALPAR